MGLTFTVGNPSDVFFEEFAERVKRTLASYFSGIDLDSGEEPFYSDELGWSGWRELQEKAVETVGEDAVLHFLSMEA